LVWCCARDSGVHPVRRRLTAGGGGDSGQQPDVAVDLSGSDGPVDSLGFEPAPLPYFYGTCRFGGTASLVPTDRGQLPHGLKVLATGLPRTVALEVDATNAYFATSSALMRLSLSGGTPEMMVSGVAPLVTAIDDQNIYWLDSGVTGQITILRAPLTANGATPTMLASQAAGTNGRASQFTVGGGYVYFSADNTIWRVSTGGGTVQTVSTTMEPRGIAAATDAIYFTEFSDETVQKVTVTGTLPAMPAFLKLAYVVPNAIVLTGAISTGPTGLAAWSTCRWQRRPQVGARDRTAAAVPASRASGRAEAARSGPPSPTTAAASAGSITTFSS
jgi:hypothetical protein